MGIWNRREIIVEEAEEDKPIEEQILDALKEIKLQLVKFDKRLTVLETKQTETVGRLQSELKDKNKFVESLLSGLLSQHFSAKPNSTVVSGSGNSIAERKAALQKAQEDRLKKEQSKLPMPQ